jgi:hypothetical protein
MEGFLLYRGDDAADGPTMALDFKTSMFTTPDSPGPKQFDAAVDQFPGIVLGISTCSSRMRDSDGAIRDHFYCRPGDDIRMIDWNVYAKTDRFYIKKFQAETNLTGYLVMDLSGSMGYTYRQELTKFEYCISLAAALAYAPLVARRRRGVSGRAGAFLPRIPCRR